MKKEADMTKQGVEFTKVSDIKRVNFILSSLQEQIPEGGSVLDVGCGNGVISRFLGRHGYQVYGIDVSEKTIANARSLTDLPNVKFDVVSAEQLVAAGNAYDAVVCSEVLEHLNQPSDLLKTLFQSLKENGKLIVTVPNGKGPRESIITKPIQRMQKRNGWAWKMVSKIKTALGYTGMTQQSAAEDLSHIQFFTKNDLEKLSKNNHFRIIKFAKCNFVDDVFPFSFLARRIYFLQKFDSKMADILPYQFTSGFLSVWVKDISK